MRGQASPSENSYMDRECQAPRVLFVALPCVHTSDERPKQGPHQRWPGVGREHRPFAGGLPDVDQDHRLVDQLLSGGHAWCPHLILHARPARGGNPEASGSISRTGDRGHHQFTDGRSHQLVDSERESAIRASLRHHRLQPRPGRDRSRGHEAPQRDQQFARERDDANALHSR